ncbi:MAG: hypothetical protein K6A23_13035 [Butyrivibrio sp.]|nr:hypothetical protein [Butyrivibrio sp.]
MASKTNMLKSGAKKTGTGLFNGMSPLKDEKPKEESLPKTESVKKETPENKPEEKAIIQEAEQNIQQPQQQITQPVPQSVVQPVIQEQVQAQPVVQQYVQQPITQPVYQQPMQQVVAQPIQQPITQQVTQPVQRTMNTAAPKEKSSRYEKEKFLLLDIRGLRDYVEHMAKASNMSATKYIRNLIEIDKAQNMDIYIEHKALEERLKGRR